MSAPANYLALNERNEQAPIYTLEFPELGVLAPFSTHSDIPGSGSIAVITNVRGAAARIDPMRGQASFGKAVVTVRDNFGIATGFVVFGALGTNVTLKAGFRGLSYSDFATIMVGVVEDVRSAGKVGEGYELTIRDFRTLENKQVFEVAATTLSAPATDSDVTLSLTQTTFLLSAGYLIIGGSEIVQYTGKTATTVTGVTRGVLGSTAIAHLSGAAAQEMIRLTGHILDVAVAVMTNTDKTGMGIDSALIDTAEYTAAKAAVGDCDVDFRITSRANGKQWLEEQIFKVVAGYPVILADGKTSIRLHREPAEADSVADLDENENTVEFTSFSDSPDRLWNLVVFKYDYDPVRQIYATEVEAASDSDSITKYGERKLTVLSQGLRTGGTGVDAFITARAEAIVLRYATGSAVVTCESFLRTHLIREGDIVRVTSQVLPDKLADILSEVPKGVTNAPYEVIGRDVDYTRGRVRFELQATGFSDA